MKITLPIITRDELVDGKRVIEYEDRKMNADFSLGMQLRFEAKFPELAKNGSIIEYAQRVAAAPRGAGTILSELKCVYCLIDTDMSFIDFVKQFDFSREEYVKKLICAIKTVIDVMLGGAAEKN